MHLLDAWTTPSPLDLARLLGIPAAVLLTALLPGRGLARAAALACALCTTLLGELAGPWTLRAGWALLWLLVAWQVGRRDAREPRRRAARRGAFETGAVALPLGLGLLLLLLAAVTRQTFAAVDMRRASLGVLVLGVGLLHLAMQRHARRAALAVAALGLGLGLLAAAARAADVTREGAPVGAALAATAIALALQLRLASGRERHAGSVLVADAHELHD